MRMNRRNNKLGNIGITIDGIKFDSRKEGNRYCELKLLQRAGKISDLKLQKRYELIPAHYEEVETGEFYKNSPHLDTLYCSFDEAADWLINRGVIVPPCKVGQTVYWYDSAIHSKPYPMTVTGIADYGEGHMWVYCKNGTDHRQFRASSFGKTVFLTKEEAVAKLKEGVADA